MTGSMSLPSSKDDESVAIDYIDVACTVRSANPADFSALRPIYFSCSLYKYRGERRSTVIFSCHMFQLVVDTRR